MGHVFAEIDISNPRKPDLNSVRVKALVDTEALMLCIPEHIALQLKLETESIREVSVADGRRSYPKINRPQSNFSTSGWPARPGFCERAGGRWVPCRPQVTPAPR